MTTRTTRTKKSITSVAKRTRTPKLAEITALIHTIRGKQVMLDRDLARVYAVPTKALNQAVRRNLDRSPDDFMLQCTLTEAQALVDSRSQTVTLKRGTNVKHAPLGFTQEGIAMLSSVLRGLA